MQEWYVNRMSQEGLVKKTLRYLHPSTPCRRGLVAPSRRGAFTQEAYIQMLFGQLNGPENHGEYAECCT